MYTNLAVTSAGEVFCWGQDKSDFSEDSLTTGGLCGNVEGQSFASYLVGSPKKMPQLDNVKSVSAGSGSAFSSGFACAVRGDGKGLCWGNNELGQLGRGSRTDERLNPAPVSTAASIDRIDAGDFHACLITNDKQLFCWGLNNSGQLGGPCGPERICQQANPDNKSYVSVPAKAPLEGVVEVRTGSDFTCARTVESKVLCWGANVHGQLGINDQIAGQANPTPVVWRLQPTNKL